MDSAVLASRIESNWPQVAAGYMGKMIPPYNHLRNPALCDSPNPNLAHANPLHISRKQQQIPVPHQNGDEWGNPTASDDAASSLSRRPSGFAVDSESNLSHYVSFDISTLSRLELRLLKSRLVGELEQVRSLADRIESGEFKMRGALKNTVKEKKLSGIKRSTPFSPGRKEAKRMALSPPPVPVDVPPASVSPSVMEKELPAVGSSEVMKMCKQMLTRLMRQKFCWIFNKPVDVDGLQLYDYYEIVKKPMDLGTVKSKLSRNLYPSPDEFGADIRLTFNNALLYNPEGQQVHHYAKDLLAKFEELFDPICKSFEIEKRQQRSQIMAHEQRHGNQPQPQRHTQPQPQLQPQWRQANQGNPHEEKHANMEKLRNEEAAVVVIEEARGSSWSSKNASPGRPSSNQQDLPVEPRLEPPFRPADPGRPSGRSAGAKLPKPKAKDPNKREMTMEEKHKLGAGLQSLPDEKMSLVVQIIKKRNGHLTQDGDEIELDIEAVDTETLWELDRFVTNYKKAVSKIKRQALMPINNSAQNESNMALVSERVLKKAGEVGEEDVDIGDEMPMSHFPPVEIEKDDEGHAASGSSSSSSSSSSGSSSSGIHTFIHIHIHYSLASLT
ncbi:hypothetical protein Dimus_003026 [Dionaea muscipula]